MDLRARAEVNWPKHETCKLCHCKAPQGSRSSRQAAQEANPMLCQVAALGGQLPAGQVQRVSVCTAVSCLRETARQAGCPHPSTTNHRTLLCCS